MSGTPQQTVIDCGACPEDQAAPGSSSARRLMLALLITASFLVIEVIGGIVFNSLALLSDAVHMVTDVAALALAVMAQRVALRPRTPERSYGFRRAETLAAFVNGIALAVGAIWIVREALERWDDPPEVVGGGMMVVAIAGLVANLASAWILSRGGSHAGHDHGHSHNLNTRAALFHVLSDAAGSVGAIIAAGLVMAFGWVRADAAVSFLLAALILYGAWRLVRSAVDVLMEGAPRDAPVQEIERTMRDTPGVTDVHDLHAWSISDGFPVVTAHVVVDGSRDACEVARHVGTRLRDAHGITHATIQPEVAPNPSGQPAQDAASAATTT